MVAPWPSGPGSESVPSSVSLNPVSASSLVALPTRRRMPPRSVNRERPCLERGSPSPEGLSVSPAPRPWLPAACPWHAVTARPCSGAAPGGPAVWPGSASGPRLGSVPPRNQASSLASRSGRMIPRAWYTCGIAASGCPSPVPGSRVSPRAGLYSGGAHSMLRGAAPSRPPWPARQAHRRFAFSLPTERTTTASSCPMTYAEDPGTSFSVRVGPKRTPGHPRLRLSQCCASGRETIAHSVHCLAPGSNTPHQEHRAYMRARSCRRSHPAVQQGTWYGRRPGRP
mmetsp:Transcript_6141/g.14130  ORF Transcript_6141/g.14130 Transcript_6141/m.14130 type:complete len:283 (-) Transcript_6141:24-872(-)